MRELNNQEISEVAGGDFGTNALTAIGGIAAITGGTIYTVETGGVGGFLGGGAAIAGGVGALSTAFNGFYNDISSYFN